VEKNAQKDYNEDMPKLYEYFGLIVLFYSNEHYPIHKADSCQALFPLFPIEIFSG